MEILFGIVCTIHKSCASRFRREEEGLVLILFKNYLIKVSWLIPQHWEIRKQAMLLLFFKEIFAFTRINNRIFKYNFDHFLVGFKHCAFSTAFQHIHFSRKRNGKKRSIINKPSFIQHTMVENMVCIFWFNASLRSKATLLSDKEQFGHHCV